MLRKKDDESLMDYAWRMMDEERTINNKLSLIVNKIMEKNDLKCVDIPEDFEYVDTMNGLKWYKITNIVRGGIVKSKTRAIIWVDFNLYDSPEDVENNIVERKVELREFSSIPRRMQLFILRKLDIRYNN